MDGSIEDRIRLMISLRRKLQAHLIFCQLSCESNLRKAALKTYIVHIQRLLEGIDGLLLLVTEEERYILELHLVGGMKWETVMEEYCKKWASEMSRVERTYKYRQQGALRKIEDYVEHYIDILDFSWLQDPIIDELATLNRK
jgi:hypothetical protein